MSAICAARRSIIKTAKVAATTAVFAALPTPSVPFVVLYPLYQPIIPMAKPSIITVILFNFLAFWNEYIIALTLLPNGGKTLPLGLINLMQVQKTATDYGALYAGLVIVMIPTIVLYILVQKKLTEGMTAGGIKE